MPGFYGDKTNSVRIEGQEELLASLRSLPEAVGGKYMRAALAKGMATVEAALIANTPIGPTGNLKAAAGSRTVYYRANMVAFGVVGYKRAVSVDTADNKGYHSHFVEFGTADRTPKKRPFLSSYGISDWRPPGWNGRWPMVARKVRGARALHPLGNAFAATRSQALGIVISEMQAGLEKGIAEVARKGL